MSSGLCPSIGLAVENGPAARERVGAPDAAIGRVGERLGHREGLGKEALQPPGDMGLREDRFDSDQGASARGLA